VTDETLSWPGARGRHRAPQGAVARATAGMVRSVRNLGALPERWWFFSEPFDVLVALSALFGGVPAALGFAPQSLVVQFAPWVLHVWGGLLCAGAVATFGSRWRIGRSFVAGGTPAGLSAGLRLGRAGMLLLATGDAVYGLAILANGVSGIQAGALTMAWAGGAAVRAWVLSRQLAEVSEVRAGSSPGLDVDG
jgi:hypothetical protein